MPFIPSGLQRQKIKYKEKKRKKNKDLTMWQMYTAPQGKYQRGTLLGTGALGGCYLAAAGAPTSGALVFGSLAGSEVAVYAGEQLNKQRKKERARLLRLRKTRMTRAKRKG